MEFYNKIKFLDFYATCVNIDINEHEELMRNARVANKKIVNKLVRKFLPDLYSNLNLNLYNPYQYYKTKTHIILVHSSTEYFLKIN